MEWLSQGSEVVWVVVRDMSHLLIKIGHKSSNYQFVLYPNDQVAEKG